MMPDHPNASFQEDFDPPTRERPAPGFLTKARCTERSWLAGVSPYPAVLPADNRRRFGAFGLGQPSVFSTRNAIIQWSQGEGEPYGQPNNYGLVVAPRFPAP